MPCTALVGTIISLARTVGIERCGEGVELEAQRDLLAAAGCTLMQGNFFGRPVPPAEFARMATGRRAPQPVPIPV